MGMPKLTFERSIEIAKPPADVFEVVADLSRWRPWNPWLVMEPTATVTVAPDRRAYSWSGKVTGSGEMRITAEEPPRSLDLDLEFLAPFKSNAKVRFTLEPREGGTLVSWSMDSSLPFFLFFMKKVMTAFLGMDYQRGLSMLKDYVETGAVPSRFEEQGPAVYPGCEYVGITTECALDDFARRMHADFEKLREWQRTNHTQTAGSAFSIYHTWDLPGAKVKYTSGYPVVAPAIDLPPGLVAGVIPRLSTFKIEHVGSYRHLGNAWSAGMQLARSRVFRQSKSFPPFELYETLPGSVPESQQRVALHFPMS